LESTWLLTDNILIGDEVYPKRWHVMSSE